MKNTRARGIKKLEVTEIKVVLRSLEERAEDAKSLELINWEPSYDLYILDETIFISIELPGVELKDITINVGQNYMIISGIKRPLVVKQPKYRNVVFHNLEISYGRFFRRIDFPLPVEAKDGDYKLERGVLTIKFPVLKEHIIPIEEA